MAVESSKCRYGAGYMRHYHRSHEAYARELSACGGKVDVYEILGMHFTREPDQVAPFCARLGKPVIVHSFAYALGNPQRPTKAVRDRTQRVLEDAKAVAISEHIAVMGTDDTYAGTFLTPPGLEEQTRILIENARALKRESPCAVVLENPVCFYNQVGPQSIGEQFRQVCEEADVGILLSLSNISFSDPYVPIDKEAMLAALPLERIEEIHYFLGHSVEQRAPGLERMVDEMRWQQRTLEALAARPECRPSSIIFELDATDTLAEPEQLRDMMEMARDLFFKPGQEAA